MCEQVEVVHERVQIDLDWGRISDMWFATSKQRPGLETSDPDWRLAYRKFRDLLMATDQDRNFTPDGPVYLSRFAAVFVGLDPRVAPR